MGGSEFWIGLKKVLVRSRPPGPNRELDPLFDITNGLMVLFLSSLRVSEKCSSYREEEE